MRVVHVRIGALIVIRQMTVLCRRPQVKDEIDRQRKAKALAKHENKDRASYNRSESINAGLSESGKMRIIAMDLHEILQRFDVQASREDCLKVLPVQFVEKICACSSLVDACAHSHLHVLPMEGGEHSSFPWKNCTCA